MGGSSNGSGTYVYHAAVAAALCHGPIAGIGQVWVDKDVKTLLNLNAAVNMGTNPQTPWAWLTTHKPAQALNYNGLAYVYSPSMLLDSNATLGNMNFEVYGIGMIKSGSAAQTITNYASVVNSQWFNPTQGSYSNKTWIAQKFGAYYYLELNPTGVLQAIPNIADIAISFTGPSTLSFNMLIPNSILNYGELTNQTITLTSGQSTPYRYTYDNTEILRNSESYPTFQLVSSSPFTVTDIIIDTVISFAAGEYRSAYGTLDACPTDIITDILTNPVYGVYEHFSLGDFEWFKQWCLASTLMLSPVFDETKSGASMLTDIMDCCHGEIVWSGGQLKLRSYADILTISLLGSYNPNITPIYELTNYDFITESGDPPVKCSRINTADAHNNIFVEFYNRSNAYNTQTIEVKDQGDITTLVNGLQKGSRPKKLTCHAICDSNIAMTVAQHQLQRECYIRNTYTFTLGYQFICLEPMDLVTLTDTNTQLDNIPVLIKEIEENEDGKFDIIAEEYPWGVNSVVAYPVQNPLGHAANYNCPAPNVNPPLFLEPTEQLLNNPSNLALWIGVSGPVTYGGCQVWVSSDGNSYTQVDTIRSNARMGVTTSTLPIHNDPDTSSILGVDLRQSNGGLTSGTQTDADLFNTLCYVGGEFISYETAKLTGTNSYDLTYIRRGVYGSTIQNIPIGSLLVRVDGSIVKYPFTSSKIGQQLWFKFPALNIYGGGLQDLSSAIAYTYTLQGTALISPPADVTGLVYNFSATIATISWNPIVDTRTVTYQILMGPTLATAIVVGTTNTTSFASLGDGFYYVRALTTYSKSINPPSLEITGAVILDNIVESFIESGTNPPYKGTKSGGAVIDQTGRLWLANTNGIITNTSGTYNSYNTIIMPSIQSVQVSYNLTAAGDCPSNLVGDWPNFAAVANVVGDYSGKTNVQVMISTTLDGTTWNNWVPFVPGKMTAKGFATKLILTTSVNTLTPVVTYFDWSVDVPDRIDSHLLNVSCAAGGSTFTFTTPFNIIPNIQVVILNSASGDYVIFTSPTTNSNVYPRVMNGGSGVSRTLDIIACGY